MVYVELGRGTLDGHEARRRHRTPDELPVDVGGHVLHRQRVAHQPGRIEHGRSIGRVLGHEGRQPHRGGGRAYGAHRTVEPVGGWIVRGASVEVVGDAAKLLEVEAGHVSLHDVAEEAGGLGPEQHRRASPGRTTEWRGRPHPAPARSPRRRCPPSTRLRWRRTGRSPSSGCRSRARSEC